MLFWDIEVIHNELRSVEFKWCDAKRIQHVQLLKIEFFTRDPHMT